MRRSRRAKRSSSVFLRSFCLFSIFFRDSTCSAPSVPSTVCAGPDPTAPRAATAPAAPAAQPADLLRVCGFFFFTLVTGPRRSLSLKLSDTRVYEPQIRFRIGKRFRVYGLGWGAGAINRFTPRAALSRTAVGTALARSPRRVSSEETLRVTLSVFVSCFQGRVQAGALIDQGCLLEEGLAGRCHTFPLLLLGFRFAPRASSTPLGSGEMQMGSGEGPNDEGERSSCCIGDPPTPGARGGKGAWGCKGAAADEGARACSQLNMEAALGRASCCWLSCWS